MDASTLQLLDTLVASLTDAPLLLLLAVRSSAGVSEPTMQAWLQHPSVTHVDVGPLDSDAARELVTSCVQDAGLRHIFGREGGGEGATNSQCE